jgi:nucleoside-diphosphate-sugar epimerase
MPRSVLVTGGAGFVGSNLVRGLLERGDRVRVLDDLSTGRLENLAPVRADIEFVEGDVRRPEDTGAACRGIDVVFHEAAMPSVIRSLAEPIACAEVNLMGTLNVLVAARDHGVRRVVVASSSSIYGNGTTLPRSEGDRPDPRSPYAVSKLAAEQSATTFTRVHGLDTVVLRYFNVYGPGQNAESRYAAVVPRFLRAAAAGEPVTIYGDGTQSRDFTFVDDVVEANLLAGGAEDASGAVLNIAAGRSWTVSELAAMVGDVLGIDAARRLLGFEPRTSLDRGLALTAESLVGVAAG